jgi:hypothetical protein
MSIRAASPPFDRWPTQWFRRAYGHCWYDREKAMLITQSHGSRGSVAGAQVLCDLVDAALEHERDTIAAAGGLLIFHDWRSLEGYDSEARVLVTDRMRKRPRRYARRTLCVVNPTPLWRMALTVADLTYALLDVPPATFTANMDRALALLEGIVPASAPPEWLSTT